MTEFNVPPGSVVGAYPMLSGSPDVLTARPNATVSYLFTTPPGAKVKDLGEPYPVPTPPVPPTSGQIWPRGG